MKPLAFLASDCHDAHRYFRSASLFVFEALQVNKEYWAGVWQRDPEFIGANRAERACIGDYELLVFDLPADRAGPAVIG